VCVLSARARRAAVTRFDIRHILSIANGRIALLDAKGTPLLGLDAVD
jgi:hypothetical protein